MVYARIALGSVIVGVVGMIAGPLISRMPTESGGLQVALIALLAFVVVVALALERAMPSKKP